MNTPGKSKKSQTTKTGQTRRPGAKRSAQELLQRADLMEKIMDNVPVMMAFIDPQGQTEYVNRHWQQVLGWSLEEARNLDILARMYPDPQVRENILQLVLAGHGSWQDYRTHTKDGRVIDTTWANVPLSDGSSIGIGYDISERKQAEQRIHESEENYRLLFELSADAIAIHDGQTIQLVNPAAARMFGAVGPDDMIGKPILDFVDAQFHSLVQERFEQQRAGKSVPQGVAKMRRLDGSLLDAEVVASPYRFNGRPAVLVIIRDVTARIRAQDVLRQSEARFRALIEHSWDAVMLVDGQNRITYYPSSNEQVTGYLAEDVLGHFANEFVHPDDRASAAARRGNIFQHPGSVAVGEYRIRHKNGQWIWVESIAHNLLHDPDVQAVVIHTRDISARKLAEEALRASEARFRALVENGWDGLTLVDRELNILYSSPANERIIGYKQDERAGKNAVEFIHPDDLERVLEYDRILADAPGAIHMLEYRARARNGSWKWIESVAHNRLEDPGLQAIVINFRDITERKQAEQQHRESETRFRSLIEQAPVAIVLTRAGKILYTNPRFMQMLGIADSRQAIERPIIEFLSEPARSESLERTRRRMLNLPVPGIFETTALRTDGDELEVEVSTAKVELPDGPGNIAFLTDITERKRAQQMQARLTAILEATPDYVGIADPQGRLIYINRAGRRMVQLDEGQDLDGLSIGDMSPAWANEIISGQGIPTALREGVWSGETARLARDGHEIPVTQVILAHKDSRGQLEYLSTIARDISERKLAEARIRRQLDHLTALSEIDRAITSSFDLHISLETVLGHVVRQLGVDAADILLFDPASNRLDYVAGNGFRSRSIESYSLNVGESNAGKAVLEGRAINIPNLREQPGSSLRSELLGAEGFVSYSSVPLVAKAELKGVLEVFHRRAFQPDEEWLEFLDALAEQAAIAIDNATLFEGLQRSHRELSEAYDATIEGWSRALDLRDKETEGHTQRVTDMTIRLARLFGLSEAELLQVRRGALLHDIGKMGVPDEILFKRGPLTEEEWAVMKKHPTFAYEMLAPIGYLHAALDIPYCHHEKWDGKGYPRGLSGEQIPLAARIFAAIDVWDALRSDRPYRAAWTEQQVRDHIRSLSGNYLDPQVVKVFLESNIPALDQRA